MLGGKKRQPANASRNPAPVALVTGAGRRLGRQIALALGRNGFDVIVNYHSSRSGAAKTAMQIRGLGRRSAAIRADVSKQRDVRSMVKKSVGEFGRIDLLVNNSAIFTRASLRTTTERIWDQTLAVNLKGAFLCAQAVAPHMLKQGGGRIVNIASLGGLQAWKEHLSYSVSKSGVIMLTRILARELAPSIQVNAIAPGTIIIQGEESAKISHVTRKKIPLRRYGSPSDITDMVVYLATRGQYITGQVIPIDGGRSITFS